MKKKYRHYCVLCQTSCDETSSFSFLSFSVDSWRKLCCHPDKSECQTITNTLCMYPNSTSVDVDLKKEKMKNKGDLTRQTLLIHSSKQCLSTVSTKLPLVLPLTPRKPDNLNYILTNTDIRNLNHIIQSLF